MTEPVMTNEEICRHYRLAKNKNADLRILSDLTLMRKSEIVKILRAGGIEVNGRTIGRESAKVLAAERQTAQDARTAPQSAEAKIPPIIHEEQKKPPVKPVQPERRVYVRVTHYWAELPVWLL